MCRRCRAWEEQSPLPTLFRRYEEEVQRLQAQCQRLEEESEQLARLLAEADLERLSGAGAVAAGLVWGVGLALW